MEMLQAEFGGRCAYCGQTGITEQVEHLLPRSAFPFDSYFNVLPACTACNNRKGARTALEAGMTVHDDAYAAFCDYVRWRKVPHVYHTMKKGLLNLLRRPGTSGEAERRLGMLANDLVTISATQRSPRPLARYLATRLERKTTHRPAVTYCAGRHTALYRSALLPEYSKEAAQGEDDRRNHAVDAIVLGCDLPSASALENPKWNRRPGDITAWFEAVRAAGPDTLLGLPRVEPVVTVPNFEEDLGGGYVSIDLTAFNWNRKRKGTHVLDPFGLTSKGLPIKRVPAATVLETLKDKGKRADQIASIAHRSLRETLQADPDDAPNRLVEWLQRSIRTEAMGNHPADRVRRDLLKRFRQAPVEKVLSGEEPVPPVIGIKCLILGSQNKVDVTKVDRNGKVFQHYQADPVIREMYVGYRMKDGELDRGKPLLFTVNQVYGVRRQTSGKKVWVTEAADSPLRGRPHGSREEWASFLARWRRELAHLWELEGIAQVFRITQGCVIERVDGSRFQFRNFDRGQPWMKTASFKGINRVHRSPLSGS
jgi:hypothetical protein